MATVVTDPELLAELNKRRGKGKKVTDPELLARLRSKSAPRPDSERTTVVGTIGDRLAQGATLGFSDEIEGGLRALAKKLAGDEGAWGDLYASEVEKPRQRMEQQWEEHPYAAIAGNVAGAFVPGAGTLGLVGRGGSWLARLGRGAGYGAGLGAVGGFGGGEGGLEERLGSATSGAAFGAGIGAAAVPTMAVLRGAGGLGKGMFDRLFRPRAVADRRVAGAYMDDFLHAADPARAAVGRMDELRTDMGPWADEVVAADAGGENVKKLMRLATDRPSAERDAFRTMLEERQSGPAGSAPGTRGQAARLAQLTDDTIARGRGYFGERGAVRGQQSANASADYAAAYADPIAYSQTLEELLMRPSMQRVAVMARRSAQDQGHQGFGQWFVQLGNGRLRITDVPGLRDLHRMRMTLDHMIRGIRNKEQPSSADNWNLGDLEGLRTELDTLMKGASPRFAAADARFGDDASRLSAMDDTYRRLMRDQPEELATATAARTPAARDAAQVGAARAIRTKLAPGRPGLDRSKRMQDVALQQRLGELGLGQRLDDWNRGVAAESELNNTLSQATGGSPTGERIQEGIGYHEGRDLANIGGSLMQGNFTNALKNAVARGLGGLNGMTRAMAEQTLRRLSERDPAELEALLQRTVSRQQLAQIAGDPAQLVRLLMVLQRSATGEDNG